MHRPTVILDCGSGYTKMGFSGNMEPSFVLPTAVALNVAALGSSSPGTALAPQQFRDSLAADMDFCIGDEALAAAKSGKYRLAYPVQRGQVWDWDSMERLWLRCFQDYLRVDSEEHIVLLSESAMTSPDQREATAEILFETFNVQGLYIAPQPVLSFMAANAAAQTPMTGVVVDSGDSSTSVVPVVEGYVMPGSARSIPIGGAHITTLTHHMLKANGAVLAEEDATFVAQRVKESLGYTCSDPVKEFGKQEKEPGKYRKVWEGPGKGSGMHVRVEVGPERFLGPEALFSADVMELIASERWGEAAAVALGLAEGTHPREHRDPSKLRAVMHATPLPLLVDSAIQSAPIDTRRALYKTVVLSGGSTLFKDFGRRLQRDVKKLVDARHGTATDRDPGPEGSSSPAAEKLSRVVSTSGAVEVSVFSHPVQQFGVWFGASIFASSQAFPKVCRMREMYAEYGPSICRTFRADGAV